MTPTEPMVGPVRAVAVSVRPSSCGQLLLNDLISEQTSSQWYAYGPSHLQCRLCQSCWTYWKKFGGLKYSSRIGIQYLIIDFNSGLTFVFYGQISTKSMPPPEHRMTRRTLTIPAVNAIKYLIDRVWLFCLNV